MAFIFVYKIGNNYRCLGSDNALDVGPALLKEGWKHTATLNSESWLEFFLNAGESDRREAVKSIS